jgi:hypothetical protein
MGGNLGSSCFRARDKPAWDKLACDSMAVLGADVFHFPADSHLASGFAAVPLAQTI